MDDIRNTSALFVGGQDTAPHTERTARELWQLLFQKTENEMAGYMNRLDQLSRDELIQAADEISAMMTCHSELMAFGENLSRKKMIFLLQQEKPLELLSEAWMEHQTVDVGETFQSLLTGLYDETRQTQVRDVVYAIQPKTIRLYPETRRQMDSWLEESNSKNRNEFVEKALRFYMGYLGTENITEYLSDALVATLRGIIADSTNRTNSILFKCAVEQGIMAHTIAAHFRDTLEDRRALRGYVVDEVKRTNGQIKFEDAQDVQRQLPDDTWRG